MADFTNLPGLTVTRADGNLNLPGQDIRPRVLILGTASKGTSFGLYRVDRSDEAEYVFGSGDLIKGMYEVGAAGARTIYLMRLGRPATLTGFLSANTSAKVTILNEDQTYVDNVTISWDDTNGYLTVTHTNPNTGASDVLYDNGSSVYQTDKVAVDEGAGFAAGDNGGSDITATAFPSVSGTYTPVVTSSNASKMALYEMLDEAFKELEAADMDMIVPMNVHLDDPNIAEGATGVSMTDYPAAGGSNDILGKVYKQEYQGKTYYWWDTDNDGSADIFPSVGSASATTDIDGNTIAASAYESVNFAHLLASYCYNLSRNENEARGFIAVKPPTSYAIKDLVAWIGSAPTRDSNGNVTANGTGLLGNKWMVGTTDVGTPGFFATDNDMPSGSPILDSNDQKIDIGQYISVVASPVTFYNSSDSTGLGYTGTGHTAYAGLAATLDSKEAPTYKTVPGVSLHYALHKDKLDALVGAGYVTFSTKTNRVAVLDGITAALSTSDYKRYSTFAIASDVITDIRRVCEPFIGRVLASVERAAINTAVEGVLNTRREQNYISNYEYQVTSTAAELTAGIVNVEVIIVPAFEIKKIQLTISMSV